MCVCVCLSVNFNSVQISVLFMENISSTLTQEVLMFHHLKQWMRYSQCIRHACTMNTFGLPAKAGQFTSVKYDIMSLSILTHSSSDVSMWSKRPWLMITITKASHSLSVSFVSDILLIRSCNGNMDLLGEQRSWQNYTQTNDDISSKTSSCGADVSDINLHQKSWFIHASTQLELIHIGPGPGPKYRLNTPG